MTIRLFCTHCDRSLRIQKSTGEFRTRICNMGHMHYTEGDNFIDHETYKAGSSAWTMSRPNKGRSPRHSISPQLVQPIPRTAVRISTGHLVHKTTHGHIYRMEMKMSNKEEE